MIKKTIKYFSYLLILIMIVIIYLSYFGIKTKRFNHLIKDKISQTNNKIDIELNEVNIILNFDNFTVGIKTSNPNIVFEDTKIKLKKIETDFPIRSFFKKEFTIKNAKIATKKNSLKDMIKVTRTFRNTPQLYIFNKMVKEGVIIANIDLNFDDNGKLSNNYNIRGSVRNAKLRLLNKKNINHIDFNFNIKDKQYLLESGQIEYKKLKLSSKRIEVSNKEQYFLFEGDVSSQNNLIDFDLLKVIFKNNLENLDINNINFGSENNFSFKLEKKFKISNFKIDSKIDLQKLTYKKKTKSLKTIIPNYNDSVELIDHKIELFLSKNKLLIKGKGNFSIDEKIDKINYEIQSNDDKYNFKSQIELKNIPLQIKLFNYTTKENKNALLNIEGTYEKNKNIYFKNILLKELENNFQINGLSLNQNYKINYIEEFNFDFLNDSKKKNKILLKKKKKKL